MKQIIAWLVTAGCSALGVFGFLKARQSQIWKAFTVGMDFMNIIRESLEDSADDKFTPEEIGRITDLAIKLKQDLKGGSK